MKLSVLLSAALLDAGCPFSAIAGGEQTWQEQVRRKLPLLGHRNWIVVADAA